MRPPEEILTERLALRPVRPADALAIFAYASSPAVTCFSTFPRHSEPHESRAFAQRCAACWENGDAFPWAITRRNEDVLLGIVELHVTPPKAEIAYILREAAWGHGFAYEAAFAVSAWALDQPTLFRLWATCHPSNQASIRVLEKLGFHQEATLQNWVARPQLEETAGSSLMFARLK